MSSSGESASPGVSFSPGFLGAILLPGLGGGTTGVAAAFLESTLAAAALALSFSSFALAASCALVRTLAGLSGVLCAALAGVLAAGLACFAAAFTGLEGIDFAGAFFAGADLGEGAFAPGFFFGFG